MVGKAKLKNAATTDAPNLTQEAEKDKDTIFPLVMDTAKQKMSLIGIPPGYHDGYYDFQIGRDGYRGGNRPVDPPICLRGRTIDEYLLQSNPSWKMGQMVTLMGEDAFYYVHDRDIAVSDTARLRLQRQKLYLLEGEVRQGKIYEEFYVDENAPKQLILETLYLPVEN